MFNACALLSIQMAATTSKRCVAGGSRYVVRLLVLLNRSNILLLKMPVIFTACLREDTQLSPNNMLHSLTSIARMISSA